MAPAKPAITSAIPNPGVVVTDGCDAAGTGVAIATVGRGVSAGGEFVGYPATRVGAGDMVTVGEGVGVGVAVGRDVGDGTGAVVACVRGSMMMAGTNIVSLGSTAKALERKSPNSLLLAKIQYDD
jgi:hypothetical protein